MHGQKISLYPDEILLELMQNFTLPTWTLLEILAGLVDETGEQVANPKPVTLTMMQLADRIKISPQHFRVHVAMLQGANAIRVNAGFADARTKDVEITENGLRMLQLREHRGN
ncbi:hypothetical protein [Alicyclobacillus macrosporangiidus]|uniref:Uncharacterized protein n=1 Tax=Alicyclobacillus macrosporangiidus TaxID=392015 RepID=A0A1I7L2P3_9BACL|nr:hypothetical protein [Alicyclobacillus macrosporangiidus]SFV03905.1 hypothetical protein SAMN05421543_12357 [Alicyclobacillus macrosporangiidus]